MRLTAETLERHKRHILLKEIGGPGVQKLLAAHVTIIGAGALGGPCALYLAAAGVGRLSLFDDDVVDRSNLQRQIQFSEHEIGLSKAQQLAQRLRALNPMCEVDIRSERVTETSDLPGQILVDATDNFPTRFLLNRMAHRSHRYLVSGAASQWSGQVSTFASGCVPNAPCYQCFVPEIPPGAESCEDLGVVGALTGMVGSMMALEVIKLITGAGETLIGRLQVIDALSGQTRMLALRQNPDCQVCKPQS